LMVFALAGDSSITTFFATLPPASGSQPLGTPGNLGTGPRVM
jgi:hypothetical protein